MKVIALISGGIDSPVAANLMIEKGLDVVFVHFDSKPFSDEDSLEKVKELVGILAKKHKKKLGLYIVPHGDAQAEILKNCDHKRLCVICRRTMYRVAERIAEKEGAVAILTGENLGQVASQTLDNLAVESFAIKKTVLRPLLGYDKTEIVDIAKEIKTYWTSIMPGMCCTVTPKYPETHAELRIIEELERGINVERMISEAVKNAKKMVVSR